MIASRNVYGKAPTRLLHRSPIAVSGSGHTGKIINSLRLPSSTSPPHKRCLVGGSLTNSCDSPNNLTALRAWRKQCLPRRHKTRRVPSRHCRDARVSMVIRLRPCMVMSTLPPRSPASHPSTLVHTISSATSTLTLNRSTATRSTTVKRKSAGSWREHASFCRRGPVSRRSCPNFPRYPSVCMCALEWKLANKPRTSLLVPTPYTEPASTAHKEKRPAE